MVCNGVLLCRSQELHDGLPTVVIVDAAPPTVHTLQSQLPTHPCFAVFGIFSLVVMPRLRAYSEELNSEETAEESTVPPPTVTAVASPRQLQQRRKDR